MNNKFQKPQNETLRHPTYKVGKSRHNNINKHSLLIGFRNIFINSRVLPAIPIYFRRNIDGNLSDFLLKYLNTVLNNVSKCLKYNKLSLNTTKTNYIILHNNK